MSVAPRTIRVLAWPARRKRADNPYSYLVQESTSHHDVETSELTPGTLLRPGWDVIHVHWPDLVLLRGRAFRQAVTGSALLAILKLHRLRGTKLVWTIHNLGPHEVRAKRVAHWFMSSFVRQVDGAISPSHAGLSAAIETYPHLEKVKSTVVPIGTYVGEYAKAPSKATARRRIDIPDSARVFLAFGQIREYKNLPYLVRLFVESSDENDVLIVAGPPKEPKEVTRMKEIAEGDPRVRIMAERIPDDDVPTLFAAADCFVAPFSNILNSSSVLLALSFGCAALAPRQGGLPELANDVGEGWLELYDGDLGAENLDARLRSIPSGTPDLARYEWPALGGQTASFFAVVIEADRQAQHDRQTGSRKV